MNPSHHAPAQGLIGRADLLRLLASAPRPALLLDDDGEQQFAYRQAGILLDPDQTGGTIVNPPLDKTSLQSEHLKLPLQMPFVHVIAERHTRERLPEAENANPPAPVYEPLSEADAKALSDVRLVNYQDLVPKARLLPALKRYLSSHRSGGLDTAQLVKQIAGQQLPHHLPRRQLKTWHPQWVVVLDFAKRLWPYRQDMHLLAENLQLACGQSGVSIRILNHGPLQQWTDWVEEQRIGGAFSVKQPWRMPPADTPVLLVSDLGLLEGADASSHQAWQAFIQQLGKAQTRPLALLPLGAEQLDRGLPSNLTLLRWSPDGRMHPERAFGEGQAVPEGLKDLLAMAAVTRRVDPPLLRAMRQLNPAAPRNAGLECAFWCHADVEAGSAATIRHEAQVAHLKHFAEKLPDYHLTLEAMRYEHHAHLRAVLNHEETLLWGAHAIGGAKEVSAETEERLLQAEAFMGKLAATLTQANSSQQGGVWWQVAQDLLQRADDQMGEHYKPLLLPLVQAIVELTGDLKQVPDYIEPLDLSPHDDTTLAYWLVRDPKSASILLQAKRPSANQTCLGEAILLDKGGLRIKCPEFNRLLAPPARPIRLCGLQEESRIEINTSRESLILTSVKRPRGVSSWGCEAPDTSLWIKTPIFCGQSHTWRLWINQMWEKSLFSGANFSDANFSVDSQQAVTSLQTVLSQNLQYHLVESLSAKQGDDNDSEYISYDYEGKTASSVKFGLDEYGVRADLYLMTAPFAEANQSFRWIEPGTFLMGSPIDEPERNDNEGPQHSVTLSRGFWLADTACTQALWQAVMDKNPSHFQDDPQLPVEQVSWLDVQIFLQELQYLLPGCQVDLPNEAEWEYACRAGTITAFNFGANMSSHQVNFDGSPPYTETEKGENRVETVPVKSLPANAWGLYEMHGNVYEWCKDGLRTYTEDLQVDPLGSLGSDAERLAIRGGSWHDLARRTRSAIRDAAWSNNASHYIGFRVCLRSIQPSQEPVSPAALVPGGAGKASPDANQPRAKPSEASFISKLSSILKPKPKPKR